jgi:pSer/pThr/pTyr-binding forkhead associated (FHA) protein
MQDSAPKAPTIPPVRPARSYVLRFISGKYQGGEFPIMTDKPVIVGRSSDLDMVLVEDMVSRKHARIAMQQDQIWIEDLGSTNGTFVNGEKVKRARLKEGDRVLIGTSILKVLGLEGGKEGGEPRQNLENVASQRRTSQARSMSGSIEEVPLPDLLQLFGTSKKNGVLVIRTDDDVGRIFLRKGNIYFAQINELEHVPPMKSVFRMLTWSRGLFDLDPPDERTFSNEVDLSVQEVLMEGLRQLDEFNMLKEKLPSMSSVLEMARPLGPALRDLNSDDLDVLQSVINYGTVEAVLNQSPTTDLATVQGLLKLLKGGYVKAPG